MLRPLIVSGLGAALLASAPAHAAKPPAKTAAPPAAKARPTVPPHRLDAASQKVVARFLDQLESELGAYVRDPAPGGATEKTLLARAYKPDLLGARLTAFKAGAAKYGATRVKLNGIEVRATLWHHRIPLRDVELYLWRAGADSFEVLRFITAPTFHTYFAGPEIVKHQTETGVAVGKLAEELVGLARRGQCDALPTVDPKYLEPFLPKEDKAHKQVLFDFHKSRFRTKPQCRSLYDQPYTHVTFRVGDVGGVLLDKDGERYSFKLSLAARKDAKRSLGILTIIDPVPPSRYMPRGALLKFKRQPAPAMSPPTAPARKP